MNNLSYFNRIPPYDLSNIKLFFRMGFDPDAVFLHLKINLQLLLL
jgi:hypothetical protein